MSLNEAGIGAQDLAGASAEKTACIVETRQSLTDLEQEVSPVHLPDHIHDYIAQNLDPADQPEALVRLQALYMANPALLTGNPTQVQSRLDRLLRRTELQSVQNTVIKEAEQISNQVAQKDHLRGNIDTLNDRIALERLAATDPTLKALRGRALLAALQAHDFVRERPDLQAQLHGMEARLDTMIGLAANSAEASALEQHIASVPLHLGAETELGIYRDLVTHIETDSTISEATKAKVRAHFGVAQVETASDLQQLMVDGYGVDETGEPVPINEDNKVEVFPDTFVYEQPDGNHIFEVTTPNGGALKIRFDEATSNQDLLERGFTAQVFGQLAQAGLADLIMGRSLDLQTGDVIDLHADDIVVAKRIVSLMFGQDASAEGRLLSSAEGLALGQRLKALQSDHRYDPAQRRTDLQALGILSPDGQIDWQQFEHAGDLINSAKARGIAPDFDALKKALWQ